MIDVLRELGTGMLDLVFPPKCLLCDALAEPFCQECRAEICAPDEGGPLPENLADVRSVGSHEGPLRQAVLRLKFGRKVALAQSLGELLAAELLPVARHWQPDALVPVPVHWTRRWERGFNQSELLAEVAGARLGLPVLPALRKLRPTPHQVGLTRARRETNLFDVFAAEPRCPVQGLRLVLIDDVRTTGATLGACAAVLRNAGAAEVYALTVTLDR